MPREHPDYLDTMEQLNALFPGTLLLSAHQVKQATGWTSDRSVRRYLPTVRGHVSKVTLAKFLCGMEVK